MAWRLDRSTLGWVPVETAPDGPTADQDPGVSLVSTDRRDRAAGGLDLGDGSTNGGLHTGGAVRVAADPTVDRWAELPEPPIDLHRVGAAAVWTGTEIIVWGGTSERSAGQAALADGERGELSGATREAR